MTMDPLDLYKKAIEYFGSEHQTRMLFEEMGELQVAICRQGRTRRPSSKTDIIEEIADVEIMLQQLRLIYNIREEDINTIKENKLIRLEGILDDRTT